MGFGLYAFFVLCVRWLRFHDDRQDHGATARGVEDEASENVADGRLDGGPFGYVLILALLEGTEHALSGGIHEFFGFAHVDEAARHEVRARDHASGRAVDCHDDDDDAFARELLAVAQDDVADVADAEAVDEHDACLHLAVEFRRVAREFKNATVFVEKDVLLGHAEALCKLGMAHKHAVLAVHGHEVARADQIVHELQGVLAGMTRDMDALAPAVDDVSAELQQKIDGLADVTFVAGNRRRRDDDGVHRRDVDLAMRAHRHARQGGHRLALAACRRDDDLVVVVAADLVDVDDRSLGRGQIAKFHRDARDVDHAAAEDRHLAAVAHGGVDDLLDA